MRRPGTDDDHLPVPSPPFRTPHARSVSEDAVSEVHQPLIASSPAAPLTGPLASPIPANTATVLAQLRAMRVLALCGGDGNVLRLVEDFEDERHLYIVMEYCPNGELFSYGAAPTPRARFLSFSLRSARSRRPRC